MSPSTQRVRLLLVEDSEDDAFFFRWALSRTGISSDIAHAQDGAAALAHLTAVQAGELPRPDLIFLDLKLPIFTGLEILEWIRSRRFDPPLNVAVLSGSEHTSDVERATALGASAYFVKPISTDDLKAGLRTLRSPLVDGMAPPSPARSVRENAAPSDQPNEH